jgi:hypothetical protein
VPCVTTKSGVSCPSIDVGLWYREDRLYAGVTIFTVI